MSNLRNRTGAILNQPVVCRTEKPPIIGNGPSVQLVAYAWDGPTGSPPFYDLFCNMLWHDPLLPANWQLNLFLQAGGTMGTTFINTDQQSPIRIQTPNPKGVFLFEATDFFEYDAWSYLVVDLRAVS